MRKLVMTLMLISSTFLGFAQDLIYKKNLEIAIRLHQLKSEIPDSILIYVVPRNDKEFAILYGTTSSKNKTTNQLLFYEITDLIFRKVIQDQNDKFYLASLQLASFADGEFGESFTDNLDKIIKLNRQKFCEAIRGKPYLSHNPMKYYSIQNNCD